MKHIYIKLIFCIFLGTTSNIYSQTATVSGFVGSSIGTPLGEVVVSTSNGEYTSTTDAAGVFSLELPINSDYTLIFERDTDYKEGVSFRDYIKMSHHILGVEFLPETWQQIAMDTNNDGNISTFDLVQLRQLIQLDIIPTKPSWIFHDGGLNDLQIVNLQEDITDIDIIGIKTGNIDCY